MREATQSSGLESENRNVSLSYVFNNQNLTSFKNNYILSLACQALPCYTLQIIYKREKVVEESTNLDDRPVT